MAVKTSRDAVEDVLKSGSTARATAALNYIPDVANADAVCDPILRASLSSDPLVNPLYKMLVGNVLPVMSLYAQKTGRALAKPFVH